MSSFDRHLGSDVVLLDVGWEVARAEAPMVQTFEQNHGTIHFGRSSSDFDNLVEVGFRLARDAQEAIQIPIESQSWRQLRRITVLAQDRGSRQYQCIHLASSSTFDVELAEDTAKAMAHDHLVVGLHAGLLHFCQHGINLTGELELSYVEKVLGNPHPDLERRGLLDCQAHGLVSRNRGAGTLNQDQGNLWTLLSLQRRQVVAVIRTCQ
mmetsp:Transcript_146128/g.207121  ORF Transcript_146128/g.207121 Transcript_146128/m.207121 type:complete len:209 (-) Transcript_146128:56-682(-)